MSEELPPRLPIWQRHLASYFVSMMGTFTGIGVLAFFGLLWERSSQNIDDEYDNDREVEVVKTEVKALEETVINGLAQIRAEMETMHREKPVIHSAIPMPPSHDDAENRESAYNALDKEKKNIRQKFYDNLNTQQQSLPPPRK